MPGRPPKLTLGNTFPYIHTDRAISTTTCRHGAMVAFSFGASWRPNPLESSRHNVSMSWSASNECLQLASNMIISAEEA